MSVAAEIGVRRTWRVELRPRPGGPVLVCALCAPRDVEVEPGRARATVVAHLARHAREDALPAYLRVCQCREQGCCWHPRHRGCGGVVRLVLTREGGGRRWRLADTCNACAGATPQAAVVRDTVPGGVGPLRPRQAPGRSDAEARLRQWTLVREMLTYLGSALPPFVSPAARLLALQCALRADNRGQACLREGFLRGMHLSGYLAPWTELQHAGWLRSHPVRRGWSERREVQLLDDAVLAQVPGRGDRARAAHWALRPVPLAIAPGAPAAIHLVALSLAAHTPGAAAGIDAEHLARVCALSVEQLEVLLGYLVRARALAGWERTPQAGDIAWHVAQAR